MRRDAWWLQPAITFVVFSSFIGWATYRAVFENDYYHTGPYLSPFYSPEIFGGPDALLGPKPGWWPGWMPFTPALLILPFPGLFRFTCYYYRGAYYKAFWMDPVNCAVGEPRNSYWGEKTLPLILQNIHRYFMYVAVVFLFILAWDVIKATQFETTPGGPREFGIGVGTLLLALNVTLLTCYTLGCHSLRHVVGGFMDTMSRSPLRKKAYDCSSCLNRWHMKWAWMSLVGVAFADLYVRMCSMGMWQDWRIL